MLKKLSLRDIRTSLGRFLAIAAIIALGVGLFAGLLARPLKKSRVFLLCYGLLSGLLFSLVMDVWTVLWYNGRFDPALWLAAMGTALPHTVLYAVSNFAFLWLLARPIGEKLERVRIKYGL